MPLTPDSPPVAIAGATGFVGSRLLAALVADGTAVRAIARDGDRARRDLDPGAEIIEASLDSVAELSAALDGCRHAFFLVHLMSGENRDYPERERNSARRFAEAASSAGVERVSYLGGLGSRSPHLASRAGTAAALAEAGPPLTYFRAAMIVGPGSESYELLRSIVDRLLIAPAPPWLDNRTQPIGIRDVIGYLRRSPETPAAAGREIQVGGPDVLTHREVIDELAGQLGVGGPRWLPVTNRIASPGVMAAGAATVTRGDPAIAAELALGLQEETIVTDRLGAALFDVRPDPIGTVFQRCLAEEERIGEAGVGG
jgi:uncharacterized protein YbjT (DUF2867 family)